MRLGEREFNTSITDAQLGGDVHRAAAAVRHALLHKLHGQHTQQSWHVPTDDEKKTRDGARNYMAVTVPHIIIVAQAGTARPVLANAEQF